MALARSSSRQPARPRINRPLLAAGVVLVLAALLLKGYQVLADAGRPLNVLVLGVDQDKTRTDVVILAHWEPRYNQLSLVSLPRDTRVEIPCPRENKECLSPDKLAHAHAYGTGPNADRGPELVKATVERFLGIRVDHYVRLDFAGFEKAVDALGGVTIDVEKNLDYDDPYQNLHIHLKAGKQKLDGKRALHYVRFRNDELGDIGRIQRTQKFFFALLQSAREQGALGKLPSLAANLLPYVKTDLDTGSAVALARAAQHLTPESLRTVSLPGEPKWEHNLWFWVADEAKKQEIVRNYITHVPAPATASGR